MSTKAFAVIYNIAPTSKNMPDLKVMDSSTEQLTKLLQHLPVSQWGVADISELYPPLSDEYPKALSMAMAYHPAFNVYNEQQFYDLLAENRSRMDDATETVSTFFLSQGIKHFPVPQAGQDPETLLAQFPHKLAAVRAGMGWIGKSSLLITEEHGPRLDLSTILIDTDIAGGGTRNFR